MIIQGLIENTSLYSELACEHGLSLYLETEKHRILFDTGQGKKFLDNARQMKVPVEEVDVAVISHGHYDHGGGLATFLEVNKKAVVYIHRKALEPHFSKGKDGEYHFIGLKAESLPKERIILTGDHHIIDEGLELFSGVEGDRLKPKGNDTLYKQGEGEMVPDDFGHEQSLLVEDGAGWILFSGCSHRGIVNIMEKVKEMKECYPRVVVGGFHLFNPATGEPESPEVIRKLGEYLRNSGGTFYTGHCTGKVSYERLKEILGDRMHYLSTGEKIVI